MDEGRKLPISFPENRLILLNADLILLLHFQGTLAVVVVEFADAVEFVRLPLPYRLQRLRRMNGQGWSGCFAFGGAQNIKIDPTKVEEGGPHSVLV